jgi:CRP-like cAMP-binding protein
MEIMPNKKFAARQILFREGDAPDGVYYLCEGRVEVSRKIQGEDVVIAELEVGDVFGEMAMVLDDRPRAATVIAIDEVWVHHFNPKAFHKKLEEMDKLLHGVVVSLVLNIRNMNRQIDGLEHEVAGLRALLKQHNITP